MVSELQDAAARWPAAAAQRHRCLKVHQSSERQVPLTAVEQDMRCRAGDAGLVVQKVSALGPRLIPVDLGDHVYSRCISVMQPGLGQKG